MASSWFAEQSAALTRLQAAVADRHSAETECATAFTAAQDHAEKEIQKQRRHLTAARKRLQEELDEKHQEQVVAIGQRAATRQRAADTIRQTTIDTAEETYSTRHDALTGEFRDRVWTLDSLLEAAEKETEDQRKKFRRDGDQGRKLLQKSWDDVEDLLDKFEFDRS
ncbi:MAG: hypothetical protein ACRCZF_20970, partial [Gemmataceae bacterium]